MSIFQRAYEQGQQASQLGFDWNQATSVMEKIKEEVQELEEAIHNKNVEHISHEMGDVLLALASLARHQNLSMEQCFESAITRFQSRWDRMLDIAKSEQIVLDTLTPHEWERLWETAKATLDNTLLVDTNT